MAKIIYRANEALYMDNKECIFCEAVNKIVNEKSVYSEELIELLRKLNETNKDNILPVTCRNCPNHPANGGTGICHCILGSPVIW